MDTVESLGYLKGLLDGLELDETTKEAKAIKAIVDVLDNIVDELDEVYDEIDDINADIDDIDECLDELEDAVYEDDDDEEWDDDEAYEEYEVECPSCHAVFQVDEDTLLEGGVACPNCGEALEFEFEAEDDEDEDDED